MRGLLARTHWLRFGAGGTLGGVKKVALAKLTYDKWCLRDGTRRLLESLHHPLVVEYFLRLDDKHRRINAWLERAADDRATSSSSTATTTNDACDLVQWNIMYRHEVDTAHALARQLQQLDSNVAMRERLCAHDDTASATDAELLAMIDEDTAAVLQRVRALDDDVSRLMQQRLAVDDIVGSSSRTWTVNVAGKAGGEEAGLFAAELADMYMTYARDSCHLHVRKLASGDEGAVAAIAAAGGGGSGSSLTASAGGAASGADDYAATSLMTGGVTFQLTGDDVYRRFRHEIGVHKVQRVPVTDAAGKMQTSTAVVTLMPVLDPVSVNVRESDCVIDYVRGSGPGGQGMQSSSNCVVLLHKPSGISVKSHQTRSALTNKELALQMVAHRLLAERLKQQQSSLHSVWQEQWSSGERSEKMRTYNYPQNRVTDHRLGKDYNLTTFMDGGRGLVSVHEALNHIDDVTALTTVLLRHIESDFDADKIRAR